MSRLFLFILSIVCLNHAATAAIKKPAKSVSHDRMVITILKPSLYGVKWKTLRLSKSGETQPGSISFQTLAGQTTLKKVPGNLALAIENDALRMIWDLKYQLPKTSGSKNCQAIAEIFLPVSKERITICQQSPRDFGQSADFVQKLARLQPKI